MSTEKPVSDPLEPEGTGVPADAAAEHTASGTNEKPAAASSGETEPAASADTPESADDDATVKLGKAAERPKPGAAEESASDATDTAADATEAEEAGKNTEPKRKASPFPLPALIGAAVLLIAALAAVGVFFFLAGDRQEELDRRAAATKAACDFGNSFATYTGAEADDYLQRLDRSATGEWKKLVAEIGPDLKTRFAETQVSSTATEVQCGYESGSGDNARVVLVIDQQFTTADTPQQQGPGQVKVAANVDMQKVDGTWLVANFDTPMMQQ